MNSILCKLPLFSEIKILNQNEDSVLGIPWLLLPGARVQSRTIQIPDTLLCSTPHPAQPSAPSTASSTVSSSLHTPSFRQPPERSDSNIFHILLLQLTGLALQDCLCLRVHFPHRAERASRTRTKSHLFNRRPRTTTKQKQLTLFTSFLFLGRAPLLSFPLKSWSSPPC